MNQKLQGDNMTTSVKTMETKKPFQSTATSNVHVPTKQKESFLSQVKTEFKKITWTSKEELKSYTQIVVAATLFCGFGVYFMDLAIRSFLSGLGLFVRVIFG